MDKKLNKIREAFGKVSALFMSKEGKAGDIIMPTEELEQIAQQLLKDIIPIEENIQDRLATPEEEKEQGIPISKEDFDKGMNEQTKAELGKVMKHALESKGCFINISYQDNYKSKKQDDLHHHQFIYKYPTDQLLPALEEFSKQAEKEVNK